MGSCNPVQHLEKLRIPSLVFEVSEMLYEKQDDGRRVAGFRRAASTSIKANKLVARLLHLIVAGRCTRSHDSFLSVSFFFFVRRNRLSEMKILVVTR